MKYFIEYIDDADQVVMSHKYTVDENGEVNFMDTPTGIRRDVNEWYKVTDVNPLVATSEFLPRTYDLSSINIYFPRFSVETYEKHVKYALSINTWIHGHAVYLGNYIIDRNDVVAADTIRKFANEDYYEFLNVKIIDPWDIVYSDRWRQFRQEVCGEEATDDGSSILPSQLAFILGKGASIRELNNTGSIINVSLHPVRETEEGIYREMDNYHGGQNSINLADEVTDYLALNLTDNRNDNSYYEDQLMFSTTPVYNRAYPDNATGFEQYLHETYLLDWYTMKMEFVIQDNENVYKSIEKDINTPWQKVTREDLKFDSWEGYHEGMFIRAFLNIYLKPTDEEAFIYLASNPIILTQELYRYLVGDNPMNKVYLEAVNMNNYTINAVNKVQQNVIQMERPDDYKANIIKPVFFRARELANLIIHPTVTEQICINLDQYKSKVDTFVIKIEETTFVEYGRTAAGVIFRIVGNKLPNEAQSGIYYILDTDGELITTGQYTYEQ